MSSHKVTFSKTELAVACSYWAHPSIELPPATYGEAAARGHEFHLKAERALKSRGLDLPDDISQWWAEFCEIVPCPVSDLQAEVAFAYNPYTDQAEILAITDRAYPKLGADWLMGTADVVGPGYVSDHKTSLYYDSVSYPEDNGQLAIIALCLRSLQGCAEVRAEIHYPGDDLEPGKWRLRRVNSHEFTSAELDEWRNRFIQLCDELRAPDPVEPRSGDHCTNKYCPGFAVCPKTSETAAALIPVERLTVGAGALMAPARIAEGLDQLKAAEAILEEFSRKLRLQAEALGNDIIDLGDGTSYHRLEESKRTYIDREKVREFLTAEQMAECEYVKIYARQWRRYGRKTTTKKKK